MKKKNKKASQETDCSEQRSSENKQTSKTKKRKRSRARTVTGVVLLLLGLAVLFYPAIGNVISYFQQMSVVAEYEQQVAALQKQEVEQIKEFAIEYNESLGQITLQDPFTEETAPTEEATEQSIDDYYRALSINNEQMMGFIKIPAITVTCPIYHDATEVQLQKGIGHLKGTSLPIGGLGTHCVLTGHTGIPGNMLFTDLDKLVLGDRFYLHILDEVLAYEIDQIKVVDPSDVSDLQIDREQDYCTLITCTPYGINSHRLLVRGHRVEYTPGEDDYESGTITTTDAEGNTITTRIDGGSDEIDVLGLFSLPRWVLWLMIPIAALIMILLIVVIVRKALRRKHNSEEPPNANGRKEITDKAEQNKKENQEQYEKE